MYLGDIEVFRTSTAEPTKNGIIWNYMKEMQHYNALWKQPQKIIFDEGNIVNEQYTGPFYTTLTATFFTVPDSPATADQILPITARKSASNSASVFTVPSDNASVAYTLPKDVTRAIVSLSGCGQSQEEFWYSNVPTNEVNTFADTTGALYPGGTFREVQLLIDGKLSGVSWPFPVIFTGGIVPGFWRPIFGIDALDLRQHEIDITPWLGYLLDGKSHTYEIRVASVNDDGKSATLAETPGSYWLVTGTIFLYRDSQGRATTGSAPTIDTPPINLKFAVSTTQVNGTNNTLTYSTNATRSISISSNIKPAGGSSVPVSWTQKLSYTNYNHLTAYGAVQYTSQLTQGADVATGAKKDGSDAFGHTYSYPLTVNSSYAYLDGGNSLELDGQLTRGKSLLTLGNPVFPSGLQNFNTSARSNTPTLFSAASSAATSNQQQLPAGAASYLNSKSIQGTYLNTTQVGVAGYLSAANGSYSYGTTEQWLDFRGAGYDGKDVDTELYNRHVKAVNSTVVLDSETLVGRQYGGSASRVAGAADMTVQDPSVGGVRQFLGRGPGQAVQH